MSFAFQVFQLVSIPACVTLNNTMLEARVFALNSIYTSA
jgi:hypothetical protein